MKKGALGVRLLTVAHRVPAEFGLQRVIHRLDFDQDGVVRMYLVMRAPRVAAP